MIDEIINKMDETPANAAGSGAIAGIGVGLMASQVFTLKKQ